MASSTNMVRSVIRLSILSLILVWTQGLQHRTTYLQDYVNNYACIHNISYATGEVHSHRGAEETTYQNGLDCMVTINAEPGKRINIRFDLFDLSSMYDTILKQCRGNGDRVYIYDKGDILLIRNDNEIPQVTLCGGTGTFPADHQSMGNVVTLRFISDAAPTEDTGFKFIYTQFTTPTDGATSTDCFTCDDGTMCIDQDLVCDDLNNCNDNSDETNSRCKDAPQDIFALGVGALGIGVVVIVVSVICLVFLIVLIVCIVCCCRWRKSNRENRHNNAPSTRPASYPNHSPVPRYAAHPPPPPPPPPSTSPYPPHAYQMYNGGQHHHHQGPGVMYHHSYESVDLPPKI
ncbi:neuropilin and tolloid-like protein 2 [Ptychodera flava]|uniref:neuropilin and tolloid-like protein 2 n=1 Tax=Ptychodera flava TaxID=63121 RepID=UPI00396A6B6B